MQTGKISIRQARPEEAPLVAKLIMTAMTDECCLFFCGEKYGIDDFHRVMTRLVERDDTELKRPFHPLEGNDVPTGDGTPRQRDAGEGE